MGTLFGKGLFICVQLKVVVCYGPAYLSASFFFLL